MGGMSADEFNEKDGEISPESLQALNDLLAQGPAENASEEEVEAFMAQFAAMPGGEEMLRGVGRQLCEGGEDLLRSLLGAEVAEGVGESVRKLYCKPSSLLRLVFRIEEEKGEGFWRRISLPSDASYYDLHLMLQDAFGLRAREEYWFEWRVGKKVEAVFSDRESEVEDETDFCVFQNRPIDLFSEQVEKIFYSLRGEPLREFVVQMEKVIAPEKNEEAVSGKPVCLAGGGGEEDFDPESISFRVPLED